MKLYKLTFIAIAFTALASYGHQVDPNAEIVFNQLKPELLELFPDSLLVRTEYVPSMKFGGNISISEVSYVLTNTTFRITKQFQDSCEEHLRDPFLTRIRHSELLRGRDLGGGHFSGTFYGLNPADGNPAPVDIIPSVQIALGSQESRCFKLDVEFIERQKNLLIIRCQLILSLPDLPKSKMRIQNPVLECIKDTEDQREYEVRFDLVNQSDVAMNIATDSFHTSAPQRHLSIAEIQVRLMSRSQINGKPPTIQTLQPGQAISIRDTFYAGSSVLSSFVVTYKTEEMKTVESDYWVGKIKSEITEMEPEH